MKRDMKHEIGEIVRNLLWWFCISSCFLWNVLFLAFCQWFRVNHNTCMAGPHVQTSILHDVKFIDKTDEKIVSTQYSFNGAYTCTILSSVLLDQTKFVSQDVTCGWENWRLVWTDRSLTKKFHGTRLHFAWQLASRFYEILKWGKIV